MAESRSPLANARLASADFGGGRQRQTGIELLGRPFLDDLLERPGRLGRGTDAAVELRLPELDDLVVRVFLEGGVEGRRRGRRVPLVEGELGVEQVAGRGLLPAAADLGDRGGHRVMILLPQVEQGELDQGGRVLAPLGDVDQELAGLRDVAELLGEHLGPQQHDGDVLGVLLEELGEDPVGLLGLLGPGQDRGVERDQLLAPGKPLPRLVEGGAGLVGLAHLPEGQDGEVLGGRSPLALGAQGLDPLQGLVGMAELDVDLRQAELHGRIDGLAGGDRPLVLGHRLLELLRRAAGLVDLAAEQVERPLQGARLPSLPISWSRCATIGSASSG